jgi:hypothetical protein
MAALAWQFREDEPFCFTCDGAIGGCYAVTVRPDPARPGLDLLVRVCEACAKRPDRNQREMQVFDEMFKHYRMRSYWRRRSNRGIFEDRE